jgi:hypothetical protein
VNQQRSEIESSDWIDVVMAFIRRSGIAAHRFAAPALQRRPSLGAHDDLHRVD